MANDFGRQYEWDAFISYASEDKKTVAIPLFQLLNDYGLNIWIDEHELVVGDSLRRKIDEGLLKSRYGIVILSRHFFNKEWPQKELDALVSREDGRSTVILPIWHNITKNEVCFYSPLLGGRKAADTTKGVEEVANDIFRAINQGNKRSINASKIQELLSRKDLENLTNASVDPTGWGPVRRTNDNEGLSDVELRRKIVDRNLEGKPTYLLRLEYERRLEERGF